MKRVLLAVLMAGLFWSGTTFAHTRPVGVHGVGPRLGFTLNPDQFHIGGHIDLGDLSNNLMMQPNIEIGFGNNVTTIAPSFEVDYRFHPDWGVWTPYLGGGVGPVFYSHKGGNSVSRLGLYMQFGVGKGSAGSQTGHFFMEGKLGLADAPDFKATIGWTFGQ
jgi:hypothetical protein